MDIGNKIPTPSLRLLTLLLRAIKALLTASPLCRSSSTTVLGCLCCAAEEQRGHGAGAGAGTGPEKRSALV